MEVNTQEESLRISDCDLKRWRTEDSLRVLQSGRQEDLRAMRTALLLERTITICLIIARRRMVQPLSGRAVPAMDAEIFSATVELRFLTANAKRVQMRAPVILQETIIMVVFLGVPGLDS